MLDDQVHKLGYSKEAAVEAIRICQDRNVLKEYLMEREKEVMWIPTKPEKLREEDLPFCANQPRQLKAFNG